VQNVQRYVCSVLAMAPDDVCVMSPTVGGAFGSGLRPLATTLDAIRTELLLLARQIPNSPLVDATAGEVALVDGKLMHKRDASRAVSIAGAVRHGGIDRIEQEKTTTFGDDGSSAGP
jgi:xanthine dehydrogenase YagR molybdenum-binding subunit